MKNTIKTADKRILLSYLTPEEKHKLVGSFVVENFWDSFIKQNSESIERFRDIAKKSILLFIESYQDVWDYVVEINKLDDIFVTENLKASKIFKGLSHRELQIGIKLLSLSLYSELEKDCLMALNKTILTELANDLREKYKFNEEEFQLLMTPSFETFFTKYHFDHFEYSIIENPDQKEKLRHQLINTYHAEDPELFELRFASMHFVKGDNMEDLFAKQRKSIEEKAAKKIAFIGEKEDLKAFEKLLEYDNYLDFKYRYNLQACPEYYVRKVLLSECKSKGIFTDVEKPLALDDIEFITGVKKLIELIDHDYIIELDSKEIFDNSDFFESGKSSFEGSLISIKKYLKEGSPCLAKNTGKDLSLPDEILIIGYEENTFLAKTNKNQVIKINSSDLESFDQFIAINKYEKEFIEEMNNSINTFISRKPYLNRSRYEIAF